MLPAVRRAGEWRGEAMGTLVGNSLGPYKILEQLGASMSPTGLGTVASQLMVTATCMSPEPAHVGVASNATQETCSSPTPTSPPSTICRSRLSSAP